MWVKIVQYRPNKALDEKEEDLSQQAFFRNNESLVLNKENRNILQKMPHGAIFCKAFGIFLHLIYFYIKKTLMYFDI